MASQRKADRLKREAEKLEEKNRAKQKQAAKDFAKEVDSLSDGIRDFSKEAENALKSFNQATNLRDRTKALNDYNNALNQAEANYKTLSEGLDSLGQHMRSNQRDVVESMTESSESMLKNMRSIFSDMEDASRKSSDFHRRSQDYSLKELKASLEKEAQVRGRLESDMNKLMTTNSKWRRKALEANISKYNEQLEGLHRSIDRSVDYLDEIPEALQSTVRQSKRSMQELTDSVENMVGDVGDALNETLGSKISNFCDELREAAMSLEVDQILQSLTEQVDGYIENRRQILSRVGKDFDVDELSDVVSRAMANANYSMSRNEMSEVAQQFVKETRIQDLSKMENYLSDMSAMQKAYGTSISDMSKLMWQDSNSNQDGRMFRSVSNIAAELENNSNLYTSADSILAAMNDKAELIYGIARGDSKRQKDMLKSVGKIQAIQETAANAGISDFSEAISQLQSLGTYGDYMESSVAQQMAMMTGMSIKELQESIQGGNVGDVYTAAFDKLQGLSEGQFYNYSKAYSDLFGGSASMMAYASQDRDELIKTLQEVEKSTVNGDQSNSILASDKASALTSKLDELGNRLSDNFIVKGVSDFFGELDISLANAAHAATVAANLGKLVLNIPKIATKLADLKTFFTTGAGSGFFTSLSSGLSSLGGTITSGFNTAGSAISSGLSSVAPAVGSVLANPVTWGVAGGIIGAIMTVKDAVDGVKKSTDWLGEQEGSTLHGKISSGIGGAIGGTGPGLFDEGAAGDKAKNIGKNALKQAGIGTAIGAAVGSIVPGIGTAIGAGIGAAAGAITGAVTGAIGGKNFSKAINAILSPIAAVAHTAVNDLDKGVTKFQEFTSDKGPLTRSLGNMVQDQWDMLKDTGNEIKELWADPNKGILKKLGGTFFKLWTVQFKTIGNAFKSVKDGFTSWVKDLGENGGPLARSIWNVAKGAIDVYKEAGSDIKNIWADDSKNMFQKVGGTLLEIGKIPLKLIKNLFVGIKDGFVSFFKDLPNKILEPFRKIKDFFTVIHDKIANFFGGIHDSIKNFRENLVNSIHNFKDKLKDWIKNIPTRIKEGIENFKNNIKQGIYDLFHPKEGSKSILKEIGGIFLEIGGLIVDIAKELLIDAIKAIPKLFIAVVTAPFKLAFKGLKKIFDTVTKPFQGLATAASKVADFFGGIKDKISEVLDFFKSGLDNIFGGFKKVKEDYENYKENGGKFGVIGYGATKAWEGVKSLGSKIGSALGFASGLSEVPQDGWAYIHKGEAVLTEDQAIQARADGGIDMSMNQELRDRLIEDYENHLSKYEFAENKERSDKFKVLLQKSLLPAIGGILGGPLGVLGGLAANKLLPNMLNSIKDLSDSVKEKGLLQTAKDTVSNITESPFFIALKSLGFTKFLMGRMFRNIGLTAEATTLFEETNESLNQGFMSYFDKEDEARETENKFQKALKKFFGIDVSDGMEGTSGSGGGGLKGFFSRLFGGGSSSSSSSSFGSGSGGSSSGGAYSGSGGGSSSYGTGYSGSTGGRGSYSGSSGSGGFGGSGGGGATSTGSVAISGGADNEQKIWNFLKSQGFSDEATAGIMGSFQVESGFDTGAIEGNYLNPSGAKQAITSLDNMDSWVRNTLFPAYDRSGLNVNKDAYLIDGQHYAPALGLAQWTGGRTQALLDYAGNNWNDLDSQLNFMMKEFGGDYKSVYEALQNVTSAEEAAKIFRNKYEGSTYKESEAKSNAAALLQKYGGSYQGGLVNTSKGVAANSNQNYGSVQSNGDWIQDALSWDGYKEEGDNITPFGEFTGANGAPWCASFVSYILANAGISGLKSAGVMNLKDQATSLGLYAPKDSGYQPAYGDVFIKTRGGANSGKGHTGFVTGFDGKTFTTIEGNSSDMVRQGSYSLDDSSVIGFIALGNGGSMDPNAINATDSTNLSMYAQGTPWVPEDQIAMVHQGEMIVPADFNPLNNNMMSSDVQSVVNYDAIGSNDNSDVVDAITWAVTTLGAKLDALIASGSSGVPKKGIMQSNSGIIYSL